MLLDLEMYNIKLKKFYVNVVKKNLSLEEIKRYYDIFTKHLYEKFTSSEVTKQINSYVNKFIDNKIKYKNNIFFVF